MDKLFVLVASENYNVEVYYYLNSTILGCLKNNNFVTVRLVKEFKKYF